MRLTELKPSKYVFNIAPSVLKTKRYRLGLKVLHSVGLTTWARHNSDGSLKIEIAGINKYTKRVEY